MKGLNELLMQISNELDVGVDFLKANLMESLPEIGRYLLVKDLMFDVLFAVLLGVLLSILVCGCIDEFINSQRGYDNKVNLIKASIITVGSTVLILTSGTLIPYLMSPKFWTIQKLLEMVR